MTPTGRFQKVLSQQKPRAGRRALLEGDKEKNPKCSLLPEPQGAPCLGHSSHFHGDATKGTGASNLRDTQKVSAVFDCRLELNSIYWKM